MPRHCIRHGFLFAALLVTVSPGPLEAQGSVSRGITEPYQDANVSATVAGVVVGVKAKEGQFVREGDVVIELDNALETLEVDRRRLAAESVVQVDAARARVQTLLTDLEATRRLHSLTKSVSDEELRKRELDYQLAVAELNGYQEVQQRARIEQTIAQAQLSKRFITAPFDGTIVQVLLEVGEGSDPQQPLFRIVDTSRCRLVVYMEQAAAAKMKQGRQVSVRIQEADGPIVVQGIVEFVSPLVDPSSGLREVKVVFENPDGRIHPGVAGTVITER